MCIYNNYDINSNIKHESRRWWILFFRYLLTIMSGDQRHQFVTCQTIYDISLFTLSLDQWHRICKSIRHLYGTNFDTQKKPLTMKTKSYRFFFFLFRYYHHIFYSARVKKKLNKRFVCFFFLTRHGLLGAVGPDLNSTVWFFFISKQKIAPSLSSVSIYVQ